MRQAHVGSILLSAVSLFACTSDTGAIVDAGNSLDMIVSNDGGHDAAALDAEPLDGTTEDATTINDAAIDGIVDAGAACDFVAELDTSCSTDEDCSYFVHTTDCCGNTFAIGVNNSSSSTASALEPLCQESYPRCGCPAMQTNTNSDERVMSGDEIQVGCVEHGADKICETWVHSRPPNS